MAPREHSISYLHWLSDGFMFAVARFSAETPQQEIDAFRERVAANGGATTEVYDPSPTPARTEEDKARLQRKIAAIRARNEAAKANDRASD
ncbi:hypothetical protein ACFXKF_39995 [Streptomyces scopuliridis]|uniref:hypothetical protein n=1 Tax=Streptomyces scopuliridis TaxID=452529 RepID=UPI0036A35C29